MIRYGHAKYANNVRPNRVSNTFGKRFSPTNNFPLLRGNKKN